MQPFPSMPTPGSVDANGTCFPFVSIGSGDPVLFVHGAWADLRTWSGLWQKVAVRHTFLAYTGRHFGTGPWPADKPYAAAVHAADLVAILDRLARPVHLVGWSYAGRLVLAAARDRPTLVRSLTLYEPVLSGLAGDSALAREAQDTFWQGLAPVYDLARSGNLDAAMQQGIEHVFGLGPGGFEGLDPVIGEMFLENAHTMLPDLDARAPSRLTFRDLGSVRAPVLLVVGADTRPIYRLTAKALAGHLADRPAGCRTVTMQRVGHGGPVQRPDRLASHVLEFLHGFGGH